MKSFGEKKKRMTAFEIVEQYLKDNGYDGLVDVENDCGCTIDDLAPCCDCVIGCEPAYNHGAKHGRDNFMSIEEPERRQWASAVDMRNSRPVDLDDVKRAVRRSMRYMGYNLNHRYLLGKATSIIERFQSFVIAVVAHKNGDSSPDQQFEVFTSTVMKEAEEFMALMEIANESLEKPSKEVKP